MHMGTRAPKMLEYLKFPSDFYISMDGLNLCQCKFQKRMFVKIFKHLRNSSAHVHVVTCKFLRVKCHVSFEMSFISKCAKSLIFLKQILVSCCASKMAAFSPCGFYLTVTLAVAVAAASNVLEVEVLALASCSSGYESQLQMDLMGQALIGLWVIRSRPESRLPSFLLPVYRIRLLGLFYTPP